MIQQVERRIKETLESYFLQLRQEPEYLNEIFASESERQRENLREFFVRDGLRLELGYPRKAPEVPHVYIFPDTLNESEKYIGNAVSEEESALGFVDETGARFDFTINLACVAQNVDLVLYLQSILLWALFAGRLALVKLGLENQKVQARGFRVMQELLPDVVYRRDMVLSGRVMLTVKTPLLKINEVNVGVTEEENPQSLVFTIK